MQCNGYSKPVNRCWEMVVRCGVECMPGDEGMGAVLVERVIEEVVGQGWIWQRGGVDDLGMGWH